MDLHTHQGKNLIDILLLYTLLTVAVFFVYIKANFSLIYFLILLAWSFFSNKNYFWIAFFFIILQTPGFFFDYTPTAHLPFIRLFPSISVTPIDLFTILMLVKILFYKKKINLRLKFPLLLLGSYISVTYLISGLTGVASFDVMMWFMRPIVYSLWIIIFSAFIQTKEDVFNFLKLIFPIAFFILFVQIYYLIQAKHLINIFIPSMEYILLKNSLTHELRPFIGGINLIFLCYIGALLLIQYENRALKKGYFYLISAVSFFSVFISATRTWFGIFLFITIGVFFRKIRNLSKIFILSLLIIIIAFSLVKLGAVHWKYLEYSSWGRISQIFYFLNGEEKKIDTFTNRLPTLRQLLVKIEKKPIIGYGFSDFSRENYDNEWGFFNTILMFGVIGFLLFVFLFISYFRTMFSALHRLRKGKPLKDALKVLLVSFCGILVGYCFTWDFFSFVYPYIVVFMMVFLGISEAFITEVPPKTTLNVGLLKDMK